MFSPDAAVPSSIASRNPRRRQRNGSEDSTAQTHNPKRLRRSGLTSEAFKPAPTKQENGHVKIPQDHPTTNGHTNAGTQRDQAVDTRSLAVRPRGGKKPEKERRGSRTDNGTDLTRNENYIVTRLSTTPARLESDQSSQKWQGEIFSNLGYGLATTHEHVTVWRYSQGRDPSGALKPLTIKLLHPSVNAHQPLPLGLLIPSSGEPALLIVMPTSGKVTYWENLSVAASCDFNRQKQQCMQGAVSGMLSGEVITKITEGEPHGFVLTLSSGRVAHMAISDPQGKPSITVRFLRSDAAQSGGLFGGLKSVFSTPGWRRDIAVVRPGVSLQRGQRQLLVATTKGVFQIWDLNWNGTQSLVNEIDAKGQFLKALAEGGDVFHDRYDHHFEVLDFTFKPKELSSKAVARTQGKGDCGLHVLTVLHGKDQSKYNLLGLTIANGSLTVDVVHPISCYKSPLLPDTEFKPQLVVPEPGKTAFVVFEKTIVLVSLDEVKETADSQLQLEANIFQDPFQDALDFNKLKGYRSVACAAEAADSQESPASCVVLVHGFGMIRVLAMPMPKVESARDRITVTARTKIEQAVFFGNSPDNLLDFAGRPEISFSPDQVESAAKEISLSITKNVSPYIPRIMPSLENQLQRRASALADLMKHLKQRYEPLSRLTRWQLLWDAEKLAASTTMWRAYQAAKNKYPGEERYILSEAIEICHADNKIENQPDLHETDGVRHWFTNDIWRIELLLPYTEATVKMLHEEFEEAREKYGEVSPIMHTRWMGEANDLQLAALETAYQFREVNAALYGIANEPMIDGVLQRGFEELAEPWTSIVQIVERVKRQVQDTLKTIEENSEGEMNEDLASLVQKLSDGLSRHIQVCNQTQIERFRWLKSRSDQESVADGELLQRQYFTLRKNLFVALYQIAEDATGATRLAEKYHDMAALVDLKDLERNDVMIALKDPKADKKFLNTGLEILEEQTLSYFTKYGIHWSDAYFKKKLNSNQVANVFERSASYQQSLTAFLRRNPEYSKLRWINEVCAERNFVAAADSLQHAQQDENILWYKKIELSMRKLALLAASQQTQIRDGVAKERIEQVDGSAAIVGIQEHLYDYFRPTLRSSIDADAEADLVRDTHFIAFVQYQPYLLHGVKQSVKRLVAREVLDPEDLIDTLTLMHGVEDQDGYIEDDGFIERRFFLALQVLKHLGYEKSEPARHALLEKIIWRRCLIQDDWGAINRTEEKDDSQVEAEISGTAYFQTLREAFAHEPPYADPPAPTDLLPAGTTIPSLRTSTRYASHADSDLTRLAKDMQRESEELEDRIEKGRLEERWQGIVEDARESVKADREQNMERLRLRKERELISKGRMSGDEVRNGADVRHL